MAERLEQHADTARQHTQAGVSALGELCRHLDQADQQLSRDVSDSARHMLGSMGEISQMTGQVREIADQTNLLALNAALKPPALAKPAAALPWWPMRCASSRKNPRCRPGRSTH